ncbi:MAG: DNA polymerase III subunit alpha, partial [Anaerolineales bacterium]|nr:DNA polymerase III subunit alpha [Anaerolineales bacterium]
FEVPEGFTAASYLRHLCEEGLKWRYGDERAANSEELHNRLNHELNIIGTMGFDTYFLIVWDLCEFARRTRRWWDDNGALLYPGQSYDEWARNDIWWNTRGSAAGSIVAYTLGITSIDPLENQLIFERFLNPGRVSMPDIDLDYPDDRRHEMVEYTMRRYGADKVAQIITFGKMKARAAVRDVGRAMDIPLERVDQIARMIPAVAGKKIYISNLFEEGHEFHSREFVESYNKDPQMRELIDMAQQLEGVSRHASSHAAGVIISDKPLVEYCPLNRPTSGSEGLGGLDRVTQWPMEIVESIGLLKVDFLGLSTLTVLRTAARLIEERYGIVYEMDNIPYDMGHVGPDPSKAPDKLFDMLAEGNVGGVFQVEGAGMRRLMMEMQPRRFDHIVAAISLYRPGPMENIPLYIERMHSEIFKGKDIVQYHTPKLETALKDTYGIIVYQEQIIRIATDLAGYEPGEADMIRKAVAKKKEALMEEHRVKFTDGALSRGESEEVINAIWDDIKFFARYGFPKGHAASYGRITCQTAFLKAHYPVEYMAALLSVEREKTEKVRKYVAEAKNLNIGIEPPDINLSGLSFTIEDAQDRPVIRFGIAAIKNVGEAAVNTILVEREANGPFKSLQDLADRVDLRKVGKRALEFMIKGQVFRRWGTVAQMLDGLDRIVADSGKTHEAASIGQMSLFGALGGGGGSNMKRTSTLLRPTGEVAEIEHKKLLEWEKEALGVHVSEHPLERPLAMLQPRTNATIGEIDTNWNGKQVRLAGMISTLRTLTTKKGDPMAFATLEDLDGKMDIVLFPRTWQACRDSVAVDQVMLVTGKVQAKGEDVNLIVDRVETNLEIAQDADASSQAAPAPPSVYKEPAPVAKTAVPAKDNGNGHSHTPPPPAILAEPRPVLQPTAAVETAASTPLSTSISTDNNFIPPPPPNFDDDSEARPAAPPPTRPAPPANGNNGHGSNGHSQAHTPPTPAKQPLVRPAPTRLSNGVHKTVIVEVRPVGNWQEACRRALRKVNEYEGDDGLIIQISGQDLKMEFGNGRTRSCPELLETLRTIPGIAKVYNG